MSHQCDTVTHPFLHFTTHNMTTMNAIQASIVVKNKFYFCKILIYPLLTTPYTTHRSQWCGKCSHIAKPAQHLLPPPDTVSTPTHPSLAPPHIVYHNLKQHVLMCCFSPNVCLIFFFLFFFFLIFWFFKTRPRPPTSSTSPMDVPTSHSYVPHPPCHHLPPLTSPPPTPTSSSHLSQPWLKQCVWHIIWFFY